MAVTTESVTQQKILVMQPELTDSFLTSQGFSTTIVERFWDKVFIPDPPDDVCWVWTGCLSTKGYGTIGADSYRTEIASRVSWILHFGPIPYGFNVCHTCDNPPCIRPDHLWLGTDSENRIDCCTKNRHNISHGEDHPKHKFTAEQIVIIRERWNATPNKKRGQTPHPDSIPRMAKEFGVTERAISQIVHRLSWKHV